MENSIVKEITELKTELKFISKTLAKVEKVLEIQWVLLEKQATANKRILLLEQNYEKEKEKVGIRLNLEKWQIRVITLASIIASILWFIINKLV